MTVSLGRLEVTTSDHVVLRYDLAGAGNRGFAAMVDFVVVTLVVTGLAFAWLRFGQETLPALLGFVTLAIGTIAWSYFILLEWLWNGQTVGKRLYGLRVIGADGAPATFLQVLVRNLVRVVDFLPGFYGIGLTAIAVSPASQRLGDLAAATFVVRAPRPQLDWLALRTVAARPETTGADDARLDLALGGEAQRLVREFVSREAGLAPEDRAALAARIAAHLRTRVRGATDLDDAALIRAVARALRARGER